VPFTFLGQPPVLIMTDDQKPKKGSIKDVFLPGKAVDRSVLFQPDEMDIYCNKVTKETFIFHGKDVDYETLERLEYNPKTYAVTVFRKDGSTLDLGVKVQWLVRPYFSKATEVQIVQTKDGKAINGTFLPITHKTTK
jgi:hypothetical protein